MTKRVYHAVDKEFISEPGRAPPPPPSDVNSQQEKHTVSEPVTSTTPEQQHLNQAMHTPPTNPTYPHGEQGVNLGMHSLEFFSHK